MVGLLCGCCNLTCECFYGYGNRLPGPASPADYYWSYVNANSPYVDIFPSDEKTQYVRDGRFWRYKLNSMCIEEPPSVFAGKYYECDRLRRLQPPDSILKTHDNNYKTHNFLFETDASVSINAALAGASIIDPGFGFVERANVYTVGCVQSIGDEYASGLWWHGLLVKQLRSAPSDISGRFSTHILYEEPSLWYVVFREPSLAGGDFPWSDEDGVWKFIEKPISWGEHRLGIGIETPKFGYQFSDQRVKNNFYLDGVIQFSISEDEFFKPTHPYFCGSESNWSAYGCITMTSGFWEPRIVSTSLVIGSPYPDRFYFRQNPINSRSFDNIAFTKHEKPLTRP